MKTHSVPAAKEHTTNENTNCNACNAVIYDSALSITTTTSSNVKIKYIRCQNCGLLSMYPLPTQTAIAELYDADYYGLGETKLLKWMEFIRSACMKRRARRVFSLAKTEAIHILDIGAGDGRFLKNMHDFGCKIYGTELECPAYNRASMIPEIHLVHCDITQAAFEPEKFNIITIWHVLEHMPDPAKIINHCQKLLAPGGLIIIEVPNLGSWQSHISGSNAFHLDPPRHLYQFTKRSLTALLNNANFKIFKQETASLEMGVIGVMQSWLNIWITPRDLFYDMLRTRNQCRGTILNKALSITLAILLIPFALIITLLESAAGRGPVLRYFCQKPASPPKNTNCRNY